MTDCAVYIALARLVHQNVRHSWAVCMGSANMKSHLGICHAGGGVLLQGKKDFILHFDMGPESTFYQYTTVSNFSSLSISCAVLCLLGSLVRLDG